MKPLLAASDLKAYFTVRAGLFNTSSVRAVDGVSLEIRRGETLALVGESGSGKTTLGRAILRLIEPTGGSVHFDGEDVTTFRRRKLKAFRRKAQAIFQDPYSSISPYMSVRDIITEPLLIHGFGSAAERDEKVHSAIQQVKLSPAEEIADKYPHGLSGGQRQRVCIARSIILDPEFVVADEPVSMVDASNRAEILQLLRELQERKGIAFLYITHDIASARHFSDRMAVMYLGTVVETGPTDQVIEKALHPYTKGLLAAVPEPDPENRKRLRPVVPGEPPSASAVPSGCPFHPRCPDFMKDRCEIARPELREVSAGYRVACYLYG